MIELRLCSRTNLRRPSQKWLGLAVFWIGFWCVLAAAAATFTASLDRDTITLGETATLSLTFSGGTPRAVPALPASPNLQITSAGTSQQITMIDSEMTSTVSYNFVLTARQPGDYTIPALSAEVDGQKLSTQPLTLKVLKPNAPSPEAVNAGNEMAFLKVQVPKKALYVGESVVLQVSLYLHQRVVNLSQFQFTAFPSDSFSVGNMVQGQRRQVQVGNSVYSVIPLVYPLRAVKAGAFTLGPITASAVIDLPSANRRRDPFDPFGMFGTRTEQRQVTLAAEAVPIQCLPLPRENMPPSFNGAVGNYTMSVTAGPTNVAAGDPITVKIQISGRGTLDTLTLPEQAAWREFKTFPPTSKVEPADQLGLQGSKSFEQIIVPQSAEVKSLPAIEFSFFDPDQKAYRTLSHPAVALVVRPGGVTPAPTMVTARQPEENAPPSQDIVPNKQRLGALAQIGPPLALQPWFLALQGVPVLALISAAVWRRRTEQLANNPRLRRQRQVARIIHEGLATLRRLAAEKKSEEFFATLFHLLQERLGERLDLPATAITEAVIEEHLRPRGVPESTLAPLQELFQTCNLARYAPIKTSQELAAIVPGLEGVLEELREVKL